MADLRISPDLKLGLDSVTKTFAILAQRRKGKTYTANVIAEEMVGAGIPWVALDPTGAWWGLRSSADGKREGLPVLVIGGDEAYRQLPLGEHDGKVMADLVVDEPGWYVFDLSAFESRAGERRFAADFAERLYRRKGKTREQALHLFIDEAELFVPQERGGADLRMIGAFESIVKRGGIRGLGTTLISQRAAAVNKNVLEQIDVLVVLRTVGPNDRKAIEAYVKAYGTAEQREALMGSLASLALGEAWVWEPGSGLFERRKIRERRTFNSSATGGTAKVVPRKLAKVDVEALRDKIEATIEKAKAEDPKELRRRIASLEKELKARPAEKETVEVEKVVEIPVLANGVGDELKDRIGTLHEVAASVQAAAREINTELARIDGNGPRPRTVRDTRPPTAAPRSPRPARPVRQRDQARTSSSAPSGEEAKQEAGDVPRPKGVQLNMLAALGAFQDRSLTALQLGVLVGKRASGGYFRNMLGALRTAGYVEGPNDALQITQAGLDQLDEEPVPPTEQEIQDLWRPSFSGLARDLLDLLIERYPESLTPEELGELTDKEHTGGYFRNMLGALRSAKVVVNAGDGVRASDDLFLGAGV